MPTEDGRPADRDGYSNPASPAVLTNTAPWDISRASSATPTASSSAISAMTSTPQARSVNLPPPITPSHSYSASQGSVQNSATPTRATHSPTQNRVSLTSTSSSPTRARSTNDPFSDHDKSKRDGKEVYASSRNAVADDASHPRASMQTQSTVVGSSDHTLNEPEELSEAQPQPPAKEK